MLALFIKVSTM